MERGNKRFFVLLFFVTVALSGLGVFVVNAMTDSDHSSGGGDGDILFYQHANGLGAGGYDVVAYFEDEGATLGNKAFEANFAGMTWRFTSPERRDKFAADPARYLPKYGGHCAYGTAQGYLVSGDPRAWTIHDGALYFNYNKNIRNSWLSNVEEFIRRSENNWQQLNRSAAH